MGSRVAYRCEGCGFWSGELAIGWGKGGRARFWGALAVCPTCKRLTVVNLAGGRSAAQDQRCGECRGLLVQLEGIADDIRCPGCEALLHPSVRGSWM